MRDAASAGVGAPSDGGACYKGRRRLLHVEAAVATQGAGVRYNRRRRLLHRAPALATTGSGGCYTGCRLPLQQAEAVATQGAGVRYNRRWRLLQRAATATTRLLPAALAVATNAFGGCYIGCRRAARTPARPGPSYKYMTPVLACCMRGTSVLLVVVLRTALPERATVLPA